MINLPKTSMGRNSVGKAVSQWSPVAGKRFVEPECRQVNSEPWPNFGQATSHTLEGPTRRSQRLA